MALLAEGAIVDPGVEGGEEQVLEHRPVILRALRRVVFERPAGEVLLEQRLGDQPLLLQEPDEEKAGDQADDVALGRSLAGAVVGEAALRRRPLEPLEQLAIEAAVEELDVERPFPRGVQTVEIADAVRLDQTGKRELGEDVEVRPVRARGADVLDQGHAIQDVAAVVPPVGAAMDDGQGQGRAVPEQDDHRHGEAAIDGARRLRQLGAAVGPVFEVRRHEQERLDAPPVEIPEQPGLAADLLPGDLEDDVGRPPGPEQPALPLGQRPLLLQQGHERIDAAHVRGPLAVVAERVQQRNGPVPRGTFPGEAGQRFDQGFTHRPVRRLPPRPVRRR